MPTPARVGLRPFTWTRCDRARGCACIREDRASRWDVTPPCVTDASPVRSLLATSVHELRLFAEWSITMSLFTQSTTASDAVALAATAQGTRAGPRKAFRALHERGCFVIPNPWDVGSARYLQHLGFPALATTSAGFAFSHGLPDSSDGGVVARDQNLAYIAAVRWHCRRGPASSAPRRL